MPWCRWLSLWPLDVTLVERSTVASALDLCKTSLIEWKTFRLIYQRQAQYIYKIMRLVLNILLVLDRIWECNEICGLINWRIEVHGTCKRMRQVTHKQHSAAFMVISACIWMITLICSLMDCINGIHLISKDVISLWCLTIRTIELNAS